MTSQCSHDDEGTPYERRKRRERERQADMSRSGRDIGDIGLVAKPGRRLRASKDFRFHCETYHAETFSVGWSDDHLAVIGYIENVVTRGGLLAVAMPRGGGKTSLVEAAAEWAALNGWRSFVALIGAAAKHAKEMLDSIKVSLETCDLLAEDYPEAVAAIRQLEGTPNRCKGQTYGGERTHITWGGDHVVFPSISPKGWAKKKNHRPFLRPDGWSLSSGSVIRVAGLTGTIRGMKHKRPDGATTRPDLVIPDDPQTDRSARSPSQCETRERLLSRAVLKLGGPKVKISGIMPCTVIRRGDVADSLLDRARHPEWNGVRMKMLYSWPTNKELWERYATLRKEGMREGDEGRAATEFYRNNRQAMDAGAKVAWEARYNPDELSALQHAMNLWIDDPDGFMAECQGEPRDPSAGGGATELTADQVADKLNRIGRGLVPAGCQHLTAFVDVQGDLLYWLVAAWSPDFTGYVIDYGTHPEQRRSYFTLAEADPTLAILTPGGGVEAAIYAGLERVAALLLGRPWVRDDGAEMRVERLLIDANWGQSTEVVNQFCRQCAYPSIVMPSHGKFVGPGSSPLNARARKDGDRVGLEWRVPGVAGKKPLRHILFDTNYWKSFVHARLATPTGGKGCLSLFGAEASRHRMLADHLTAEVRDVQRSELKGRKADVWVMRPGRPDNHLLDCLVGACVAASMQGSALAETGAKGQPATKRPRVSFAELQRRARG